MTDFCEFVPDDPSCQPKPEPEPTQCTGDECQTAGHQEVDGEVDSNSDSTQQLQAQLTFLLTALSLTVTTALQQFRYRGANYYDAGDAISPNLWKLLNTSWNFFTIAFMGTAFVTQLLSMFGVAGEVNLLVWTYGGMADMVFGFVTGLVAMYAYDAYWGVADDATNAEQANGALALSGLETDLLMNTAYSTSAAFALYMQSEHWWQAQISALPEERQTVWLGTEKKENDEGSEEAAAAEDTDLMALHFSL